MKSNFMELGLEKETNLKVSANDQINILEINQANVNSTINIYVASHVELTINMTSLNYENFKKKFVVNVILEGDHANVIVRTNCLGIGSSHTEIEVNGICDMNYDSKINIQIDGIIDSAQASITGKPKFLFKSNTIEARHGLTIGKVNDNELHYLLSRGIKMATAKYMLISAKLFECLKYLPEQDLNQRKQQILSVWGEPNA